MSKTTVQDIPSEIIVSVFMMLPCKYDRVRMSLACKSWRGLYLGNLAMMRVELPWLVLPSTTKPMLHTTCGAFTYKLGLPASIKDEAAFCGSHEGGWVALAMNTGQSVLTARNTLPMPATMNAFGARSGGSSNTEDGCFVCTPSSRYTTMCGRCRSRYP